MIKADKLLNRKIVLKHIYQKLYLNECRGKACTNLACQNQIETHSVNMSNSLVLIPTSCNSDLKKQTYAQLIGQFNVYVTGD